MPRGGFAIGRGSGATRRTADGSPARMSWPPAMTSGEKNQSPVKAWRKATSSVVLKASKDALAWTWENPASRNMFFSSFPIWGCPPLAARRFENTAHAAARVSAPGSRNDDATNISRLAMMPPGFKTRFTSDSAARVSGTCMRTAWQWAMSKESSSKGRSVTTPTWNVALSCPPAAAADRATSI